jgi:hypothetical protein
VQIIRSFEDSPSRLNPIGFGLQLLGLDQWLWPDALKHLPIAFWLATWEIDGIGSQIFYR